MSETRISREEIKGITRDRRNERADATEVNKAKATAGKGDCDNGSCEWQAEQ